MQSIFTEIVTKLSFLKTESKERNNDDKSRGENCKVCSQEDNSQILILTVLLSVTQFSYKPANVVTKVVLYCYLHTHWYRFNISAYYQRCDITIQNVEKLSLNCLLLTCQEQATILIQSAIFLYKLNNFFSNY